MGVIYQIRNIITDKIYVGSTKNFAIRKSRHLSQLRTGKHHSILLQRAYNKYGEESFMFEILEEVPNDRLLERELEFLNLLKPFAPIGYNVSLNATNCVLIGKDNGMYGKKGSDNPNYGRKNSTETLQKMSAAQKGRIVKSESIEKFKQTLQEHYPEGRPSSFKGHHHTLDSKQKLSVVNSKPVKQLNKDTLEIVKIYSSGIAAYKETGINNGAINHCCNHDLHYNSAGGYKWEFCTKEEYDNYQKNHCND